MEDVLLRKFFEPDRWSSAIRIAVRKGIDRSLLRDLCSPDVRIGLYRRIRDGQYEVAPPHEAQIPKDDGTMRTVYVNEPMDRVLLSIANDLLFELCPEFVHPTCGSYQKGIGCADLVKTMSRRLAGIRREDPGRKIDLSKYFDSVARSDIDAIFDRVEAKLGASALIGMIRKYYHMDIVLDMEKKPVEKYSSLRQGCAVAAFLADAVLYDVDAAMSAMGMEYCRYSDDILLLGERWDPSFDRLSDMLSEKGLKLNPKKIEYLEHDRWFSFLGFSMKKSLVSLSPNRIASFQSEIDRRTVNSSRTNVASLVQAVEQYMYVGNGEAMGRATGLDAATVNFLREEAGEFVTNYHPDGIFLDEYYNEENTSSYGTYLAQGGGIGYQNYMRSLSRMALDTVADTIRDKAPGMQVGILTDAVWQN